MIDFGLLASIIIAFGVPSLLAQWWTLERFDEPVGFLDAALGPAFAGLAVGRIATLAMDDPSSIGSVSDMIIIRSGVEFWPGVVAASAVLVWGASRANLHPLARIADLAPLGLIAYAGYEAACVFRDGCFGPESAIGLQPPGLTTTMLPVGWFMAAAVVISAIGLNYIRARQPALVVVVLAALAVASVRAVGSIWLPHVGEGLTRQHLTSIVLATTSAVIAAIVLATRTVSWVGPRAGSTQ